MKDTGKNTKTNTKKNTICAIVLAGGKGSRMGSDIPKQYMELAGIPMLAYSLIAFEKSEADKIFVVCDGTYEEMIKSEIIEKFSITKFAGFAANGKERTFSVKNGIEAALKGSTPETEESTFLLIHDGARPLISQELIQSCIKAVRKEGAVIPAIPLKDTIKEMSEDTVKKTPDRSCYMAVQTPQCFRADIITFAYDTFDKCADSGIALTDDASLVEIFTDVNVKTIPGDENNIKITTPLDMKVAELMIKEDL